MILIILYWLVVVIRRSAFVLCSGWFDTVKSCTTSRKSQQRDRSRAVLVEPESFVGSKMPLSLLSRKCTNKAFVQRMNSYVLTRTSVPVVWDEVTWASLHFQILYDWKSNQNSLGPRWTAKCPWEVKESQSMSRGTMGKRNVPLWRVQLELNTTGRRCAINFQTGGDSKISNSIPR